MCVNLCVFKNASPQKIDVSHCILDSGMSSEFQVLPDVGIRLNTYGFTLGCCAHRNIQCSQFDNRNQDNQGTAGIQ